MNAADDADDRQPARLRIERTEVDAFADGIGAGPESVRERVIDDYVGAAEVGGREEAAFDERDAHRFEVAEVCVARLCDGTRAGLRSGLSFDEEAGCGMERGGEGEYVDAADGFHAGEALDAIGHLLELQRLFAGQRGLLIVREFVQFGEGDRGLLNFHGEDVIRAETWIDAQQAMEAANQQACAYEWDESERDLGDDESAA